MKPLIHAKNSVRKHGGTLEDYLPIHNFIDSSKATMPDMRHRAVLHSAFGIFIAEKVFGVAITLADGSMVSVRDIAEEHVIEDLGFIPTVQDYLKDLPLSSWIGGGPTKKRFLSMKDPD